MASTHTNVGRVRRFYDGLFELLASVGIKRLEDLDTYPPNEIAAERGQPLYTSEYYGWVGDLFDYMADEGQDAFEAATASERGTIYFDHSRGWHLLEIDAKAETVSRYACLFPRRVMFMSDSFVHWPAREHHRVSADYWYVPYEFLRMALVLRPLLRAELATLFPMSVRRRDDCWVHGYDEWELDVIWDTWNGVRRRGSSIEVVSSGQVADSAGPSPRTGGVHNARQVLVAPWLRGVDLDRYVGMVEEDTDAFFLYERAVSRVLEAGNAGNVLRLQDAVDDTEEALRRLNIKFELKRRELRMRGVTTAIGLSATVASFVSPEMAHLAPILGSATVVQGSSTLYDLRSRRTQLKAEDRWFLWRSLRQT